MSGRIYMDNERVHISGSKVEATVLHAEYVSETGKWKYYLEGWTKPVTDKDIQKIR